MNRQRKALSPKSVAVLRMIAEGRTYDQMLTIYNELTYFDIFRAAREALDLAHDAGHERRDSLDAIRKSHPRAYEPWSSEEELKLRQLVETGQDTNEIAAQLQRQPGAIRSRILRLKLTASDP